MMTAWARSRFIRTILAASAKMIGSLITALRGTVKLTVRPITRGRTAQMREQERGAERRLGVLARRAEDGPPSADRIVIDRSNPILLPGLQLQRLSDVLALGDEQALLDEGDHIRACDLPVVRLRLLSHAPGSPMA